MVTTAQLAAHYAKLYSVNEIATRVYASKAALGKHVAHCAAVGYDDVGRATLRAHEAELSALVQAHALAKAAQGARA